MTQPAKNSSSNHKPTFWRERWVQNTLIGLLFLSIFLLLRPYMQGDVIQGQVPTMHLKSINNKIINLQAINQQGKPILVHIWATWCPICKLSKDGIESIAQDYAVINISTQSADNNQLLVFAKANNMNPDNIVNDLEGLWLKRFGAKAVPADFIIAPNGDVAFVEIGFTTEWGLRLRLWWVQIIADYF